MSNVCLVILAMAIPHTLGCTPCSVSLSGSIDLNTDNAWSSFGDPFCVGYTKSKNETSGTFYVSLTRNDSASNPDFNHPLSYQLAIYNDDSASYPTLNSSMSCVQKLNDKRTKLIRDIIFFESNSKSDTYVTQIPVAEPVTRQWWFFLTHCDETDMMDDTLIYPIIDYKINLTLSSWITEREETCSNSQEKTLPPGVVAAIICIVVVLIVIVGVSMWACDTYKRKKVREEAMRQGLIMETQNENPSQSDIDPESGNDPADENVQLQSA
eukprot:319966_1